MNKIEFFTPVYYEASNCLEFLTNMVERYFFLSGRVAHINAAHSQVQFVQHRSSCLCTALKIITYMTVVIPLIMFVAKLILRCCFVSRDAYFFSHQRLPNPPPPLPVFTPAPVLNPISPPLNRKLFRIDSDGSDDSDDSDDFDSFSPPLNRQLFSAQGFNPITPPRAFQMSPPPISNPFSPPLNRQLFPAQGFNPITPPRSQSSYPVDDSPTPPQNPKLKERIVEKLDRTVKAFDAFKAKRDRQWATKHHDPTWIETAAEVNEIFQDVIQRLRSNENVPLPVYYHASRADVDNIARDNNLKQSPSGAAGQGVYLSTGDEHYHYYGDFTYAIDPSAVEKFAATCFLGMTLPGEEESEVWIAVHSDIPISGENVAYVVVPDARRKAELFKKFWQGDKTTDKDGIEFYATIVTRAASDWIRRSYREVYRHPLPAHWHIQNAWGGAMPSHVIVAG